MISDSKLIYSRYAVELIRFATGLVGPFDASDVVTDAMVRCLRTVNWGEVGDPRGYLYRAVLNESLSFRRSARRRLLRERASFGLAQPNSSEAQVRPDVLEAVRSLSVRQRAAVFLTYWEDLAPAEVALRLDISEGAVRRHLARGRERLRRILSDD